MTRMSITEQRLKDYQLQMSIYAEQHKMLLASDVLDMIEQLQDDLKDDVDKVVEELEKTMQDLSVIEVFSHIDFDSTIQSGLDNFLKSYNSELLRIVKQGGVYEAEQKLKEMDGD